MPTRFIRLLAIIAALTLPVGTGVAFIRLLATQPASTREPPITTTCREADALGVWDEAHAVARYEAILAEATTQEDRECAAFGLRRLQPPTISDRIYQAAENALSRQSERFGHGRPVRLTQKPNPGVAAGIMGIEALLIVIAIRQFFLWRAERFPSPVQVEEILAPPDEPGCTGLAEIMRDRLTQAGIAPGTVVPGDLRAVVVEAVEAGTDAAPTSWPARALRGLSGALLTKAGFVVTGKAFRDAVDRRCSLSVEVRVARSGQSLSVITEAAESFEDAAIRVAYELYLLLAERPSVRRRTPVWLAWTSAEGLRAYHDGNKSADEGDLRAAEEELAYAAELEPANVLILLRRWQCLWGLYKGEPDDAVLRAGDPRNTHDAHLALQCALEVVHRAPLNDDGAFASCILLSYVDEWVRGWGDVPEQERRTLLWLVEHAVRRTSWRRRHWSLLGAIEEEADIAAGFRKASECLARRVVVNQRYWRVLLLCFPLARRREGVDRIWPGSRTRFTRRQAALALLDGIQWDQLRTKRVTTIGSLRFTVLRLASAVRRARIRVGARIWRDPTGVVGWNLASAYACQVRAVRSRPQQAFLGGPERAKTAARRFIARSLLGTNSRLSADDIHSLLVAPDFLEPGEPPRALVDYVADWASPLVPETPDERTARVWSEQLELALATITTAKAAWDARMLQLAAHETIVRRLRSRWVDDRGLPTRQEMLRWFIADERLWKAFSAWLNSPADRASRAELERGVSALSVDAEFLPADDGPTSDGQRRLDALRVPATFATEASSNASAEARTLLLEATSLQILRVRLLSRRATDRWASLASAIAKPAAHNAPIPS